MHRSSFCQLGTTNRSDFQRAFVFSEAIIRACIICPDLHSFSVHICALSSPEQLLQLAFCTTNIFWVWSEWQTEFCFFFYSCIRDKLNLCHLSPLFWFFVSSSALTWALLPYISISFQFNNINYKIIWWKACLLTYE